ncbi:unnamed protein product [Ectocarpus sp. 6 AP-2014]
MVMGMKAAGEFYTPTLMRMHMVVFMVVRFHTALWITNIKPVREVLRQSSDRKDYHVPWFPYVPWRRSASGKVAVGMNETMHVTCTSRPLSTIQLGRLETIINTPPLLEAFDSFCQKALCGESILLLREVAAFRDSIYAVEADDDALFKEFVAIVNKFIKSGSSYEVNIDCRARTGVMRDVDEARFKKLDTDDRADIFTLAETQTSQMLADNLLAKFQATERYQRIVEGLLAIDIIASGDEGRVHCDAAANSMSKSPVHRGSTRHTLRWTRHSLLASFPKQAAGDTDP